MRKIKGFTLIELIVVIAIIGVLAAILVPAMMGWVYRSRIATYNNNASEVCTQLQVVLTDISTSGKGTIDNCVLVYDGSSVKSISGDALTSEVAEMMNNINNNLTDIKKSQWAAEIENNAVISVAFSGNNCIHVGGFPAQCLPDSKFDSGKSIQSYLEYAEKGWK